MRRRSSRSTAASGSSSSSTSGADISARASATRCRSPTSTTSRHRDRATAQLRESTQPSRATALPWTLAVRHVAAYVEVRKERDVLRHIADVAFVWRQVNPLLAVEKLGRSLTRMEPRAGWRRPAMASRMVVLPEPEGPKSTVTRPSRRRASSTKVPCSILKSSAITCAVPLGL